MPRRHRVVRQYRRHRQHHRPAAGWAGTRLRHRTGQHAARCLVHAASRRAVRPRRRMGGDRPADRGIARGALAPIRISRCRRRRAPGATTSTCAGSSARLQPSYAPADVQRTLAGADRRRRSPTRSRGTAPGRPRSCVCGGGAHNGALLRELAARSRRTHASRRRRRMGVPVGDVEALAFAWLAREALAGRPGNLPAVTGARGAARAGRRLSGLGPLGERGMKTGAAGARRCPDGLRLQVVENDEPQPQVVVAFGFLITNCAPSRPSL